MSLASRIAKERAAWFAFGLLLAAGGFVAGLKTDRAEAHYGPHAGHGAAMNASTAHSVRTDASERSIPQTAQACRAGAYLEADRILGSVVGASLALPPDTPPAVRTELDSILYTGLQQARSEVHCVAGVLTHGYDRAYAETVEKAVTLARQRKLSKDVVALGEDVIAALRANRLMAPEESRDDVERNALR
jgi:hypothetical protein